MDVTDILGMSISASAIIILILFIRKIYRGRISTRVMAALWLIPSAKLLVPCVRGIYTVVNKILYGLGLQRYVYLDYSLETSAFSPVTDGYVFVNDRYAFPFVINFGFEIPRAVTYVWFFGAVITGAAYILRHIKFRRKFACSLPCGYDIDELKITFGINRKVTLRVSEFTDTPFTYGIFRPVIILPKITDLDNEAQLKNIICHELAHIKRFDVLRYAVFALCTALHWFNPLVWIMFSFAVRDIELACDETAVLYGKTTPEEYALALIGTEERRCIYHTVCFGGGELEERIIGIMQGKNTRCGISVFAFICVLAAALVINVAASVTTETSYAAEAVFVSEDYGTVAVTNAAAEYDAINFIEVIEADSIMPETVYSGDYSFSYNDVMITIADNTAVIESVVKSEITFTD